MKLKYVKEIKENVYKINITCAELGTATVDADAEAEEIENFVPTFRYKDLTWTGKFNKDSSGNVIVDSSSGDEISIGLIDKLIPVNDKLNVSFEISTKSVKSSQLEGLTHINSPELYCEACCLLFKETIKKAVKDSLDAMRSHKNDFESDNDEDTEIV